MTPRVILLIGAILPCLTGCIAPGSSPPPGAPTPQAQVMRQMLSDLNQVRAYAYGTGSRSDAQRAATELVDWTDQLPGLFPPGRTAAEYVDLTPAQARQAPIAMNKAAGRLLVAVTSGNRAAIGAQLTQTERNGCGFCHIGGVH